MNYLDRLPEILIPEEVMRIFGKSNITLGRWERKGKLPVIRIGKLRRYLKSEVVKLL